MPSTISTMPILTTMFCSWVPTSSVHTEMIVRTPMVMRWNSTDSSRLTDARHLLVLEHLLQEGLAGHHQHPSHERA